MDPEIIVAPAGFEQRDRDVGIGRQPVGEQAAGGAATDDVT
jgi:hypothetical protein